MKANKIDHGRRLCGKPDVPNDTPIEEVEKHPAHCRCCGSVMTIVKPNSMSLQQLGSYALVCDNCPPK